MAKNKPKQHHPTQINELRNSILLKLLRDIDIDDIISQYISTNDKNILDVFCRTGVITIKIAKSYPFSQVVGMEDNQKFLKIAKTKRRRSMLPNLEFVSLANLPTYTDYHDLVTLFFALSGRTETDIKEILLAIKPTLKIRGKLLIVDFEPDKIDRAGLILGLYLSLFYKKGSTFSFDTLLEETGYQINKKQMVQGVTIIQASISN